MKRWFDRLAPVERRRELRRRTELIGASQWFDPDFYAGVAGDLGRRTPLGHYVTIGEPAGLDPHPDFDADAYVLANPAAAGAALTHFLDEIAADDGGAASDGPLRPADVVDPALPALAWFDADWYVTRHGLHDLTIHPYAHYRRVGAADGLPPGPLFDGPEYAARHDLGGLDPVSHWLTQQPGDGPVATTLRGPTSGPHELGRPTIFPRRDLERLDVCVMIHAFHLDILAVLLRPLAAIPGGFTLLVSVVTEDDAGAADGIVDDVLGAGQRRVVRVVPNRGRNFAPLLVGFADEVAAHDIVLHLHTKKSLHMGSGADAWRAHLVHQLAGTAGTVEAILSLFAGDPTVGVVQPPLFPGLPQWANHWLGNSGRGRQLLERMGLDPGLGGGWVDYPVGGMFWARTSALAPLFGLGLAVDHFEEEAGQTDRTLAHTLERLIAFSARAAGMRHVEIEVDSGTWRMGWSSRGADRFGTTGPAELHDAVGRASLVSLDLFDTLLLRPSLDPDTLRSDAARRLGVDGPDLLRRRIDAEVSARSKVAASADSTMSEIYAEAIAAAPADADRFERLRDEEIAVEHRCATARTWLIDELRAAKRPDVRYVLMTDTYLERPVIDELLGLIGAADLFDEVYVSNEVRARKDSGSMWELVAEREACPPERWLHLGDNEFSDVQQAADRGIGSILVPSPGSVASLGGFRLGEVSADEREATAIVAGAGVAALSATRPLRDAPTPEEFGYGVIGPLTFAFVQWLVHRARADRVDHLLFAARDGELPLRVLEACRSAWPGEVPQASYFWTSRRAAFRLARRPGGGVADVLDAGGFRGSLGELFRARLGWTVADDIADRQVELPRDRDEIVAAIAGELAGIERLGADDRPAFDRHLADLGVRAGDRLGLVDLGYSATTQRALAPLLDHPLFGYYAVTRSAGSSTADARSCFAEDVVWDDEVLMHNSQRVFEVLWSAAHGQVDHLELRDGRVHLVTDDRTVRDPAAQAVVAAVQDAAIRFATDLLARHGGAFLERPLDARAVGRALDRALVTLAPAPDRVFDGLHLDDHFSGISELTVVVADRPDR